MQRGLKYLGHLRMGGFYFEDVGSWSDFNYKDPRGQLNSEMSLSKELHLIVGEVKRRQGAITRGAAIGVVRSEMKTIMWLTNSDHTIILDSHAAWSSAEALDREKDEAAAHSPAQG